MPCHHKSRLTVLDKRFLARHGFVLYQCSECEALAQKALPPKPEEPKKEEDEDGA